MVGEAARFLRVDHAWWRARLLLAVGEAARVLWEGHVDHAGSRIGFWVAVDIARDLRWLYLVKGKYSLRSSGLCRLRSTSSFLGTAIYRTPGIADAPWRLISPRKLRHERHQSRAF